MNAHSRDVARAKEDPTRERRRYPRVPAAFRVEVLGQRGYLMAHDIGLGGMMTTAARLRWPGEMLQVRFMLPTAPRAIRATCRVLHLVEAPEGVGLGLAFLGLAPEAAAAVGRSVECAEVPGLCERDGAGSPQQAYYL